MSKMYEYGIICDEKDERELIKNIKDFLQPLKRTLSKVGNKSMLDARLPYIYRYFYFNSNKEQQAHFEVYPNKDIEGKYKFKDNKEIGWILFVNKMDLTTFDDHQNGKREEYIADLLKGTKFEHIKLYEYADGEERI